MQTCRRFMVPQLRQLSFSATCFAIACVPGLALAQSSADNYPSRPVSMIIPVSPGGGTDTEARLYAQKLTESMGKQFVLDYKPGAGTTLGANFVAKAPADGHVLLMVTAGFAITPSFYKTLPYDPEKDIAPITLLTTRPIMLVVHPDVPIRTPAEYIAFTRTYPGKLNFGTTGVGASLHLAGLWLDNVTNGKVTFVHYKGSGAMLTDLLAGRVQVATQTIPVALSQAKSGKLRIVGNAGAQRSPALPDVPTFAEQGAAGYDYSSWLGLGTTGGTPSAIINKLRAELVKAGNAPDLRKRMTEDGATLVLGTPAEFGAMIRTEIGRWRKLLRDAGIQPVEE